MKEHITAIEALTRVGLAELGTEWSDYQRQTNVLWNGYPKPFACGYSAVYGFGPLHEGVKNDCRGSGRAYQQTVRVSQHFCSGRVLFSWSAAELNTALVVSIDETPDSRDMVLKASWSA